ncbi:MAG TPA: hypothetical protein PKB15_04690 [Acidimicrobiia bacterium]|nr:hypothetical protein [Acidimicrobiia bacterium]
MLFGGYSSPVPFALDESISHLIYLGFDGRAPNDHFHCAINRNGDGEGDGEWVAYGEDFELSELFEFIGSPPLKEYFCNGEFAVVSSEYTQSIFEECRQKSGAVIVCGIKREDGWIRDEVLVIPNRARLDQLCAINPSFAYFAAYAEDTASPSSIVPTQLFDAFHIEREAQAASMLSIDVDTVTQWKFDFERCRNFVHDLIDPIIPRILFGPNVGGHVSLENVKDMISILAKSSPSIREHALHHLHLLEQENFPGMQAGSYVRHPEIVVTGGRIFRNYRKADYLDLLDNLTAHQREAIEILHGNIFSQEVRRQEIQLNGIKQRYLMSLVSLFTNPNTPIDVNDEQQVLKAMDAFFARANTSIQDMLFDRPEIKVAKLQGLFEPALHEAIRHPKVNYTILETQAILHSLLPGIFDEPCYPSIDTSTFPDAAGLGRFH